DLKNPLASIKGYADLLLRRSARTPDDPNRRGLQVISEQVVRMGEMLDALLDVSRMANSRLTFDPRPNDLAEVVRALVETLQASGSELNIHLQGADESYPGVFDSLRVRQAIEQVVRNAIRFSPPDRPIELTLQRDGDAARLAVHDHGAGISAEHRPRIFEPFFRANTATGQAGMGLGLFIAQQILERHDGTIRCESEEGQGATFFLTLPLAAHYSKEQNT
ncbi:MAG TPA: HAMP domain-containing sensor histidine kinase, partial [Roseiflexaceae bacterium]|nr:HAMP domain-containing sensor histidine kinase [Roseiflexaceae bacterium]